MATSSPTTAARLELNVRQNVRGSGIKDEVDSRTAIVWSSKHKPVDTHALKEDEITTGVGSFVATAPMIDRRNDISEENHDENDEQYMDNNPDIFVGQPGDLGLVRQRRHMVNEELKRLEDDKAEIEGPEVERAAC